MTQSDYLLGILEAFEEEVEEYAKYSNAISIRWEPIHKSEEDIEHLKEYRAHLIYETYTIILRFTIHNVLSQVNHILDAWIQFVGYPPFPIHHMIGYYHILTTNAFIIPCISNALTMHKAVDYLSTNIEMVKDILIEEDHSEFIEDYKKIVLTYSHINEKDYEEYYHYAFMEDVQIFETDMAYIDFLLKRNESAIKRYKKKKNLTYYEQWILLMLLDGYEFDDEDPLPYSVIYHLESFDKSGVIKNDKKEIAVMILSVCILTVLWGVFYWTFHKGLSLMLLRDVTYFLSEDSFFIFLPSFISAIGCCYFTRYFFYKLFFKKDYTNFVEKDYLQNTPMTNLFMYRFVKLVLILSLIFTFLATNKNIQFVGDGIIDNTSFLKLKGDFYSYEEIEIHLYKDQYNGLNELIGAPTYVISTKDKDIDLYYYADVEDLDKEIIPYLMGKGVEIIYKDILEWRD